MTSLQVEVQTADDIPRVLREARQAKGWSQRKLAAEVGMPHSAIAQYETGVRSPDWGRLLLVLGALGVVVYFAVKSSKGGGPTPP
jgi:transcriptional regulator with XRE-family HTH domain